MRYLPALFALPLVFATSFAAPVAAQDEVVENDLIKVFAGHWVQSKDPAQNGALMFLTQDRAQNGEYFTITCVEADRSIRIGFPKRQRGKDLGLTLDEVETRYPIKFTKKTKDRNFLKGNIFSYEMSFEDTEAQDTFLQGLREGAVLMIEGQTLPIDLTGAGAAIEEQAGYCK